MWPRKVYLTIYLLLCLCLQHHGTLADGSKIYRDGNYQVGVHGEVQESVCKKVFGKQEGFYTNIMWAEQPVCRTDRKDTGKLLVVAPHINAHLIRLQKQSLDLFLQEPYDYIVYDDSYAQAHFRCGCCWGGCSVCNALCVQ